MQASDAAWEFAVVLDTHTQDISETIAGTSDGGKKKMYKHILVTTDGSKLANKAVKSAVAFAKSFGSRLTVYQRLEDNLSMFISDGYAIPAQTVAKIDADSRARVQANLDAARKSAEAAGVACATVIGRPGLPWEGIIDTARKMKCDAIFIASHGRRGIKGVLLGSVTHKVLTHSTIPVVVYR